MDRRSFLALLASAPIAALAQWPHFLKPPAFTATDGDSGAEACRHCGAYLRDGGRHGIVQKIDDWGIEITCYIPRTAQSPYWVRMTGEASHGEYWYDSRQYS